MFNDSTPPYWSSKVSPKLTSKGKTSCVLPPPGWCFQRRYHYFLVLDFEATCDKPQIHPQEIIEFPILKLNGRTMEIESTFHMYVQPVVHPQLTPFCTELTGIIQGMVDGQPSLQQVLERVDEWMAKEGLLDPSVKSIFVTCGDWDLKVMLPGQCQYLGLPVADYFKQWINLKKSSNTQTALLGWCCTKHESIAPESLLSRKRSPAMAPPPGGGWLASPLACLHLCLSARVSLCLQQSDGPCQPRSVSGLVWD
ncbi:ERI1 exoribonuclease 3 isoform 3-T3 [Alca torda]